MLISEVLRDFGDLYLPESVLKQIGIEIPKSKDLMIGVAAIPKLIKKDPYKVIGMIKTLNGWEYEENLIPLSALCAYYHLNINGAYELLQEDEK